MEVSTCASGLNSSSWIGGSDKLIGRQSAFLKFSQRANHRHHRNSAVFHFGGGSRWRGLTAKTKAVDFEISSSYHNTNIQAPKIDSVTDYTSVDEDLILKNKALDISPYLSGRCIYLVGMMGSGKTTVGKILAEELGYSFFDSDKLVEQAVGVTSVAQIFKQYSENFFRDNESKVLGELSLMRRLVVATGGGAVIRPINWKYMRQGITVWLDVPLEALAKRIAAVGTGSRPLLDSEAGDAYTKALKRLSVLSEERGEVYANADARVNLQYIASKLGHGDVSGLTPRDIAIEALVQIEHFLKEEDEDETVERNF